VPKNSTKSSKIHPISFSLFFSFWENGILVQAVRVSFVAEKNEKLCDQQYNKLANPLSRRKFQFSYAAFLYFPFSFLLIAAIEKDVTDPQIFAR
jgi:hypothetical protein